MAKTRLKDDTAINLAELEKERNKLLINKTNPKRLKEVEDLLNWFNWGIKTKV